MNPFAAKSHTYIENIRSALKITNFAQLHQVQESATFESNRDSITLHLRKEHETDFFQLKCDNEEIAAFSVRGEGVNASFEFSSDISFERVSNAMQQLFTQHKPSNRELDTGLSI
jgi:hypothetical protein